MNEILNEKKNLSSDIYQEFDFECIFLKIDLLIKIFSGKDKPFSNFSQ